MRNRLNVSLTVLVLLLPSWRVRAEEADARLRLAPHLDRLLNLVNGKTEVFTLQAEGTVGGMKENAALKLGRAGPRRFFVSLDGPREFKATLVLTPERLFLDLPAKNTAFVAEGALPEGAEALQPDVLLQVLPRLHPIAEKLWPSVAREDGRAVAVAFNPHLHATLAEKENPERGCDYVTLRPGGGQREISLVLRSGRSVAAWSAGGAPEKQNRIEITLAETCTLPALPDGRTVVSVARAEMERALQRGVVRAIDIKAEDWHSGAPPKDLVVDIPGARLEIKDGQRTCFLTGTPHEIGKRHGELLKAEVRKMTDSTLYVVGFAYSMLQGKWFLNEIRDAWQRLEPHCDKDYIEELKGLAEGAGMPYDEMKVASVFPELFHCSGFAVSGVATVGGKLYHGRVLDYMTEIGLQGAQVDFIEKRDGCRGWVNVGYAGFIGCVSGMNDAQVSLGEMGGRGEGKWDGTPMAFLMRQVLEKAGTLDEARDLFQIAKRTCEYYYVIADGKTRSALGVAAWPEKIEFIKQGEAHPQLPNAFAGCVLLSGGDRYKLLSQRVKDGFGKLDEQGALDLMKPPVAMGSNLHSVLFVPEDQAYLVAHATCKGHQPAAAQNYVKHDLKENLRKLEDVRKTGAR
ncbi:MAG: C45 family autoproteolytic acyltransferase/hydrolase [Planctomycetota bacterium]|nr:C45 family autoproteolytic acyltransferase/hydrolase [Planctomycetota bacterium]